MEATGPSFSIAPLLAVNFVGTLGLSIVTPFLVVLVSQWGGNSVIYGILVATYSVFQFFGASVLGRMSDRVGRRRVLLLSQLGTMLSWGVFLIAFALPATTLIAVDSPWLGEFALTLPLVVMFIARAADGLTGGNVSVSSAYLSDISSEEDRARNFGRMAVSGNLGYVVGPAMAGLLAATFLGEILPVIAAFVISAATLALIRFGLREIRPAEITETLHQGSACDVFRHERKPAYQVSCDDHSFRAILSLPNMRALMAVNFLVMLGFNVFYVVFPVHALEALNWDVAQIGIYLTVVSILMIIVEGPVLSWAAQRWSERALMVFGGMVLAVGFVLLLSPTFELIYLAAALIAVGNGLMWPTFMSVLSKATASNLQGATQGYAQSSGAIASIVGLLGGGLLYISLGSFLFVIAAIVIVASALAAGTYRAPAKQPSES